MFGGPVNAQNMMTMRPFSRRWAIVSTPLGYVLVATAVAFVVGYAAIAWLLRYLAHHSVNIFVVYRVLLGGTVLILVATGAIN